ncbi:hypothetical protein HPB52_006866 [Rhipicephalus sanguineus]|uniref:Uncharacterized protein n=1 Tax=Rhipicephalus sanguineus TaxID=34632 RepID=A0A9D4PLM3_RHISA|nr:hypothetical protein HPB52_006866 [Rhipicephalus sanguineus]
MLNAGVVLRHINDFTVICGAPVKVLKFQLEGLDVDITVGAVHALHAARLLRLYTGTTEKFRVICSAIKTWAARAGIKGAANGGISSYGLELMTVAALQGEGALPHWQVDQPALFATPADQPPESPNVAAPNWSAGPNPAKTSALFAAVIKKYAAFNFNREAVTIKAQPRLKTAEVQHMPVIVDDPVTGKNVARSIKDADTLKDAFSQAAQHLDDGDYDEVLGEGDWRGSAAPLAGRPANSEWLMLVCLNTRALFATPADQPPESPNVAAPNWSAGPNPAKTSALFAAVIKKYAAHNFATDAIATKAQPRSKSANEQHMTVIIDDPVTGKNVARSIKDADTLKDAFSQAAQHLDDGDYDEVLGEGDW